MNRWERFGRWVQDQRTSLRLSKAEACKISGISPSSWYNIENGGRMREGTKVVHQPSTETLLGIARAFEMEPADVFKQAGVPMPALSKAAAEPAMQLPASLAAAPSADAGLLTLVAQLLAEQRELRATVMALREEVARMQIPAPRRG